MSIDQEITRINNQIKKHQKLLEDEELAPLAQEEIDKLQTQKQALENSLKSRQARKATQQTDRDSGGPGSDSSNAIIEIRAAAGGDEAKIWTQDLARMYIRYAQSSGFDVIQIDESTIKVKGKEAYSVFKHESGVHRVQRVPETEKQGRIHTSTATVAVLPEIPESKVKINPDDLEWQFTRAGGPGGQYVNKASTAVRLTHKPSGINVSVRQERMQQQNKALALQILRSKLWEQKEEKRLKSIKTKRREAVGRGMRAEKIRTYNYPQNRVTDHRVEKSWHDLENILDGNLKKITRELEKTTNP